MPHQQNHWLCRLHRRRRRRLHGETNWIGHRIEAVKSMIASIAIDVDRTSMSVEVENESEIVIDTKDMNATSGPIHRHAGAIMRIHRFVDIMGAAMSVNRLIIMHRQTHTNGMPTNQNRIIRRNHITMVVICPHRPYQNMKNPK